METVQEGHEEKENEEEKNLFVKEKEEDKHRAAKRCHCLSLWDKHPEQVDGDSERQDDGAGASGEEGNGARLPLRVPTLSKGHHAALFVTSVPMVSRRAIRIV